MFYDLSYFNVNIWEVCYPKFDFLFCVSYHGIVYFAQKLQLHYNIYTLIFPIWMENILKMKIPLGSCELYAKRNIPYHENQQSEIFKIRDV